MASNLLSEPASHLDAAADAEERRALDRNRLAAMALQARRISAALPAAAIVIAILVWPAAASWAVLLWLAAIPAVMALRAKGLTWLLSRDDPAPMPKTMLFSVASGLVHSAPAWLFFDGLPVERKALLTMMLVSFATTAISTNAHFLPGYVVYSTLLLASLIVGWSAHAAGMLASGAAPADLVLHFALPVLLLAFLFVQYGFARQAERTFVDSFLIRYENDRLLAALRREREALAAERDRAEGANRAKSRFLAAASHDLRQPTHALVLLAESLKARPLDRDAAAIAGHVSDAVGELATQLDQLLDISKLDAGVVTLRREPVILSAVLARLIDEVRPRAERKRLALRLDCPDGVAADTDATQFRRLAGNLLDNAIKFTDAGEVAVRVACEGELLHVSVTDTGRGIAASEQERVWEEFYQVDNRERDRSQGLGLGLSIVRRLAHLLGHPLSLRSSPGGTTVTVTLPAATRAAPADSDLRPVDLSGLHVLVIDDEERGRLAMRWHLGTLGCTVALADGSSEAVEQARLRRPDIVLADFRLRGTDNGIDAIFALRQRHPGLPALLISGDTAPDRLRQAHDVGLPLLSKPPRPGELARTIAELTGR